MATCGPKGTGCYWAPETGSEGSVETINLSAIKHFSDLKPQAGELAHYLVLVYNKVIEGSLLKHSRRPSSEVVNVQRF